MSALVCFLGMQLASFEMSLFLVHLPECAVLMATALFVFYLEKERPIESSLPHPPPPKASRFFIW